MMTIATMIVITTTRNTELVPRLTKLKHVLLPLDGAHVSTLTTIKSKKEKLLPIKCKINHKYFSFFI